jgi:hypothetical protein
MKAPKTIILLPVVLLINVYFASGQNWVVTTAPSNNWVSVSSSADGFKLVAAVNGAGIYSSTNSGRSWLSTGAPIGQWSSVASSADGIKLVAVMKGGGIYVSTNAGGIWTATGAPITNWQAVASSADGTRLAATAFGSSYGTGWIYASTNGGDTWMLSGASSQHWRSLALSSNGHRWVAVSDFRPLTKEGFIYTSADSGVTWTSNNAPSKQWSSVASSADGTRLIAAPAGDPEGLTFIYSSTNAGSSWSSNSVPKLRWTCVASSADGAKLLAGARGPFGVVGSPPVPGPIYVSTNAGASWMASDLPSNHWSSVAASADGSIAVAVATNGPIYMWRAIPRLSIAVSTTDAVVSWSSSSAASDFTLQQNSDLAETNWIDVSSMVNDDGTNKMVLLNLSSSNLFFRLKQQP